MEWHKQLLNQLEERRDERAQCHGIVGDIFGQMCNEVNGSVSVGNVAGSGEEEEVGGGGGEEWLARAHYDGVLLVASDFHAGQHKFTVCHFSLD